MTSGPVVEILNLGRLGYRKTLRVQHALRDRLIAFESQRRASQPPPHALVLVEHEPVYTLGLREKEDGEERVRLEGTGAEVVYSDRGGLVTFHGPGQLVAYPILHLSLFKKRMALREYVAGLEHVSVHTCRLLGVPAVVNLDGQASHTGAWVNDKKICAIGVHCKRHVTTHGLAINCNVDLSWFNHIVPCGIPDKGVTSLTQELRTSVDVRQAQDKLVTCFENVFKCKLKDFEGNVDDIVIDKMENNNNRSGAP